MSAPSTLTPSGVLPLPRTGLDFADVVARERAGLERLARRLVWDPAEADDLVQLALTDAYEKWGTLKDGQAAPAWLRRIVTHRALSLLRRRRLWRAFAQLVWLEPEPSAQPDDELVRARHLAALSAELERLSPRQRAAFSLRYLEGLSLDQVADAMEMNRGTVRVHLQRAVERLRARGALDTEGVSDEDV